MIHYKIRKSITDKTSQSVNLYLKEISKYPILKQGEDIELIKKIQQGDKKAKDRLIEGCVKFVISIAKQYQGKGIDFADLIACGNIGLLKAIDSFDPDRGIKFISYAVWWIRDAILQEILNHSKPIRIPVAKSNKINKINKLISNFEQKNARAPTSEELAELMNIDEEYVKDVISQCTVITIPDSIINPDGEMESLFETLYVEDGNTDKLIKQQSASSHIIDFLKANLNDIEYDVITKYFGLTGPETSMKVIGEQNNITVERVRQIKDKAIIKLRKSDGVSLLSNYL